MPAATGIGTAVAGIVGAVSQHKASSKALAFQREQADFAGRNAEIDRRANYDQWAAQQRHDNAVNKAMGWGVVDVPDYVPGITPHFAPRSVGDYLSGPPRVVARAPMGAIQPRQPMTGTPHPYRVGDVNSYL